jgi:hypothetical protein
VAALDHGFRSVTTGKLRCATADCELVTRSP